jgi:hypothetical protein
LPADRCPIFQVAALLKNCREWEDSSGAYNPLIYGNDVDSVDIATRVAMVGTGRQYGVNPA